MQNQKTKSKPTTPEQPTDEGLDETPCSAEKILADVMQDIWNDRAMDCGEIPSCFEIKGPPTTRIYADFEDSTFVWNIIETLRARGYSILPNTGGMARELAAQDSASKSNNPTERFGLATCSKFNQPNRKNDMSEEIDQVAKMIKTESVGWQKKGFVCRVIDNENLTVIGLTCTDDQAKLIIRLIGNTTRNQLHEWGFSEDEARQIHQMHDTI